MQYFKQKKEPAREHERKFFVPVDLNDLDDGDEALADPADYSYEDEVEERRRDTLRIVAGLGDFAGVVLGAVAVLALVAVLVNLLNWLHADLVQSFDLWRPRL